MSAVIFFKSVCGRRGGCVFQKMSTSVKHRGFLLSELEIFNPFHGNSGRRIMAVLALMTRAKRWADCVQSWPPCQGRLPAFSCYILAHWPIQPVDPSGVAPCLSVLNTVQVPCRGLHGEREHQNGELGSVAEGTRDLWIITGIWEAGGEDVCGECAEYPTFPPVWFSANAPI